MVFWMRLALLVLAISVLGCHHHQQHKHITAYPLSPQLQNAPEGIPYYLPKPLLVIAKNVRHIDESKVGLTSPAPIPNAFDDQSSYGSIKANVTVPGTGAKAAQAGTGGTNLPSKFGAARSSVAGVEEIMTPPANAELKDELAPDSFFTYQIVFVPDLSQKYALQVRGGPGEVRAAMNLVNGWMYTGMGPYYMKDSSTAQNIMAIGVGAMFSGRAVADVVNEVGDLAAVAGKGSQERAAADVNDVLDKYTRLARLLQSETVAPQKMLNYAEIYIYEPTLMEDGSMSWNLIAEHHFDRDYFQPKMGDEAMRVFQSILKLDTEQSLQKTNVEREERMERARIERAAADDNSSSDPRDEMPSANAFGNAGVGASPPQAEAVTFTDQVIDQKTRQVLGLPSVVAAPVAPNQVNVNINPRHPSQPGPLAWLWGHFKKKTPKVETRVQRVLDTSPFGAGLPSAGAAGGSVTSGGTIPGMLP